MRPISLCNVSYKTITKIMAWRLRSVMESLVNHFQCSFVPNRNSGDNIIIAQEAIHSIRNKRHGKGWMVIKMDLEKTYDRLNWSFVVDTLRDIGFPESFVNMVYQFISTSNMRVIWNDEALDSFSPSLGIRLGDPISPYLFVLCVERLFHLIHDVVDQNI